MHFLVMCAVAQQSLVRHLVIFCIKMPFGPFNYKVGSIAIFQKYIF